MLRAVVALDTFFSVGIPPARREHHSLWEHESLCGNTTRSRIRKPSSQCGSTSWRPILHIPFSAGPLRGIAKHYISLRARSATWICIYSWEYDPPSENTTHCGNTIHCVGTRPTSWIRKPSCFIASGETYYIGAHFASQGLTPWACISSFRKAYSVGVHPSHRKTYYVGVQSFHHKTMCVCSHLILRYTTCVCSHTIARYTPCIGSLLIASCTVCVCSHSMAI